MKKTQVHIILLLLTTISCRNVEQEKLKTVTPNDSVVIEQNNNPTVINKNTQAISSPEITEITEKQEIKENKNKLRIKFTEIDATKFLKYKQKYSNQIIVDTTIVNKAGSFFTLNVANIEKKFSCDIDYNNCNYYKGFFKPLNKYILTYCVTGFCGTYLLDKKTGNINNLQSPFDSECEAPSLSEDKSKLIVFASSVFDSDSFIALYKKELNTQKINFKTFDSFYTSKWRIKNLIWIDNNSIALKVFDNYQGKKLVNVRYLKGEIE